MSNNRQFTDKYLTQQHEAMRWLYQQGFTCEEIREFSMRNIDETKRTIRAFRDVTFIVYDLEKHIIKTNETTNKDFKKKVSGTKYDFFFMKQRFTSTYLFTRERPKSWRREIAKESLYSLSEVQEICSSVVSLESTNRLTKLPEFDNIEIAKLNITKAKPEMVR